MRSQLHTFAPVIVVRSIGNTYAARAIDLVLPIQQLEFGVPVTLEAQPDLLDIEGFYHRSGGGFWGALDGARLVGTIGLLALGDGDGALRKMFVHRDYRGKERGIAQDLLETLLAHCRAAGIEDVYLGTISHMRAAARFYERNGFVQVSRSGLPATFPLTLVDNTFYHLHV